MMRPGGYTKRLFRHITWDVMRVSRQINRNPDYENVEETWTDAKYWAIRDISDVRLSRRRKRDLWLAEKREIKRIEHKMRNAQ